MSKPESKSKNFLKDFVMGGVVGAIAKTANAPIERVKILLQVQQTHTKLAEKQYSGILNCFFRIYKEEGIMAYWKGNLTNCLRYFPTTAINFSVKDTFREYFLTGVDPKKDKTKFFVNNLLCGGLAGAIGLTCVYSLDFARTRLGADVHGKTAAEREFNGLIDCYAKIFKSDGITGLYRGFGISVLGIFIYRALYFGLYDGGKQIVWGDEEKQKLAPFIIKFFFAQAIVMTSETISFPIDVIRRRMMMQSGRKSTGEAIKYKSTMDCWKKTFAEEGFTGFFKGNLSNIWRSLGSSLCLVLYDKFKQEWFADKKEN